MQTNYKPVTCSAAGTKLPRTDTATSAKLVLCSLEGYSRSPALSKQADQTSLGPYSDEERDSQNRVNELRIQLCTLQLSQISDLTFKKSECFSSSTAKPQNHRINIRIRQLTTTNISFPSKDKPYPGAPFAGVNVYLQHGTGHQRAAPGQSCITPGQVKTPKFPNIIRCYQIQTPDRASEPHHNPFLSQRQREGERRQNPVPGWEIYPTDRKTQDGSMRTAQWRSQETGIHIKS